MELIYGCNRKTYWRDTVYTEDTKYYAGVDDLKRALSSLKKDHTAAVKFTRDEIGYSICWESFERGIITFNAWKTNNHQWIECSYETARKRAIQLFKGENSGRDLTGSRAVVKTCPAFLCSFHKMYLFAQNRKIVHLTDIAHYTIISL